MRAAVIGLGQVGSSFDEEPGRKTVWSHTGAYLSLPEQFELVAGVDPDPEARAAFARRCPSVPVYDRAAAMLRTAAPEVVSICTPNHTHAAVFTEVLAAPSVSAVWCEKPLATSAADARRMAALAADRTVRVAVSHVRRWTPLWRAAREMAGDGTLGTVRCVRVAMGNRLWTIGSHAVDLALFLGGPVSEVRCLDVPALAEDGEPGRAALLRFDSGAYGIVQVTGLKDALVVEAEVIGDAERLTVREDRGELAVERFAASATYGDYRELATAEIEARDTLRTMSPFVEIARELAAGAEPACTARDAVAVIEVLERMAGPEALAA